MDFEKKKFKDEIGLGFRLTIDFGMNNLVEKMLQFVKLRFWNRVCEEAAILG
jgi:hypothetical protein